MGIKPSSKPECCDEPRGKPNDPPEDNGAKLIILPDNFKGHQKIPDQPLQKTLVAIDDEGNMNLVPQADFLLAADRDLEVIKTTLTEFSVSGDNHSQWIITEGAGTTTVVTVLPALADINGNTGDGTGSVIILTQSSNSALVFAAAPGVIIKTPGLLRAYGIYSTVTLMAESAYVWVLGGDVGFGSVAVP